MPTPEQKERQKKRQKLLRQLPPTVRTLRQAVERANRDLKQARGTLNRLVDEEDSVTVKISQLKATLDSRQNELERRVLKARDRALELEKVANGLKTHLDEALHPHAAEVGAIDQALAELDVKPQAETKDSPAEKPAS